mgnify:FL=1
MEAPVSSGPMKSLMTWLESEGIDYELHEHDRSLTARATAHAEGGDPHTFEKVVWVRSADDGDALIVLDADDHLDLSKASDVLRSGKVKLVPEEELIELAPDCDPGAMPAVGSLFGLPTYADLHVCDSAEVSFNAGSHTVAVRVDRAEWEKALGVVYADLAAATWREPGWHRS